MTYHEQALPETDDRQLYDLQDEVLFNLFVKESSLIKTEDINHDQTNPTPF